VKKLFSTALPVIAIALLTAGCATTDTPNKTNYERVLGEAQAAFDKSAMMKHAWLTADDALTDARKAAEEGDWEKAMKLAKKAKAHSELAQEQAMAEASATVNYID
jgi:outer membrane PBP1 activator LpoA protein